MKVFIRIQKTTLKTFKAFNKKKNSNRIKNKSKTGIIALAWVKHAFRNESLTLDSWVCCLAQVKKKVFKNIKSHMKLLSRQLSSLQGKVILMNTLILSKLQCTNNILSIPKGISKKIDRLILYME